MNVAAVPLTPPPPIEYGQPLPVTHLRYYEGELGRLDGTRALLLPAALNALAHLDDLETEFWVVLARHGITTRAQLQWEAFRD